MDETTLDDGSEPESSSLRPEVVQYIDEVGRFYATRGVPRIGGRILGLLLITNEPYSAEQLASTLQVSRSSISMNIRHLVANGLTEQIGQLGDRVDYYIFSQQAWERAIHERTQSLQSLRALAEKGLHVSAANGAVHNRFHKMKAWTELGLRKNEEFLTAWRAESLPGAGM